MAVGLLARAAGRARVPVFPVVGAGAARAVQDLRLRPEVELVSTPRHATVLLVAGQVPRSLSRPLAQVHDQVPHPRATVRWTGSGSGPDRVVPAGATVVAADGDVVAAIASCHRGLLSGDRPSEEDMRPAEPPNEWRGVGPHGQGGEGMMGGTPYGRPMPMTADDRDGLALDQLSVRVGPLLPALPPGLALDVRLQGDVVQRAEDPAQREGEAQRVAIAAQLARRPPEPREREGVLRDLGAVRHARPGHGARGFEADRDGRVRRDGRGGLAPEQARVHGRPRPRRAWRGLLVEGAALHLLRRDERSLRLGLRERGAGGS
ncbi:MAG: hypothetical protein KY434_06960, partial [Actinobacteria bacterium]|nr:hypothetical protein [Actinomycetota bacterium]